MLPFDKIEYCYVLKCLKSDVGIAEGTIVVAVHRGLHSNDIPMWETLGIKNNQFNAFNFILTQQAYNPASWVHVGYMYPTGIKWLAEILLHPPSDKPINESIITTDPITLID